MAAYYYRYFTVVHSVHFYIYSVYCTNQMDSIKYYEYWRHSSNMLWYKCITCREHNMSGLKTGANDKLLFTWFHSLQ